MLKRWVPASFIAVAMALALAGGAVLAVGSSHDSHRGDVFERAADILGIAPAELQDAHDQAQSEAREAQLVDAVERLVAAEIIDQSEADSFTAWISDRPDSVDDTLLNKLTSSLITSPWIATSRIELHHLPHSGSGDINDRMAEILGIDADALADALASGQSELAELDRLTKLHLVIDQMLEDGDITTDEANELRTWIDAAPEWLLDLDVSSRALPALGMFDRDHGGLDFLKRLPFGNRHHDDKGSREFRFEFGGPRGSFKFDSEDHDFPFSEDGFDGLFDRFDFERFEGFEELENIEGLEELFERFEGHRFFEPPWDLPEETTPVPETATSA